MPNAYLIAGGGGMLGMALRREVAARGEPAMAPGHDQFDITDARVVGRVVDAFSRSLAPGDTGVVINCAAYTDVEAAEDRPAEAFGVNERGAGLLASAAREAGLGLVHLSTDFVFDGAKDDGYREDDTPNPLSVYGASKLAGEVAVRAGHPEALIVRTAWSFGEDGACFPAKILAAARERGRLSVVDDEMGSPTYCPDLARGILDLLAAGAPANLYHLAGSGAATRYEMAVELLRLAGLSVPVDRARSATYATRAHRPANSVLDCGKAAGYGVVLPHWRDSLARYTAATAAVRQGAEPSL